MVTAVNGTNVASIASAGLSALPHGMTMDNTYGAVLLGTFFALILYGMMLHQLYTYLRIHSDDSYWIKLYVAFIVMLDTAHSVLIMSLCYLKLVRHFLNISSLVTVDWPLCLLTLITATNVVACQSYFAYRVFRIDRKCRIVVWLCIIYQVAGLGLAVEFRPTAFTVKAFQTALWTALSQYAPWISVVLGIAVFVDTVLAGVLVLVLYRSRAKVESTNLSSSMDKLIAYAVTTGVLTDLCNILGFVFALASSHYLYYAAANMLGTKVYTNSVLAALNFRRSREPSGSENLGMLADAKPKSTFLSHQVAARSEGSSDAPASFLEMDAVNVKV